MILTNAQQQQVAKAYMDNLSNGMLDNFLSNYLNERDSRTPHKDLKKTVLVFDKSRAGLLSGE